MYIFMHVADENDKQAHLGDGFGDESRVFVNLLVWPERTDS